MKKALLLAVVLAFVGTAYGQVIKTSSGNIDFLAKTPVVDITFDWSTAKVNGLDGLQAYEDYRHEEIELDENKKEADKWKADWRETIKVAQDEFVLLLNEELGKKSPLQFKLNGTTAKYKATLKITEFSSGKVNMMGASADNFATFEGQMIFTDAAGTQVAVVDFIGWKGNPSTTIYTMGEGFRVNSLFKKAGAKFGQRIYNQYFKK